jgi:addiction module RelE/StbE family toxin
VAQLSYSRQALKDLQGISDYLLEQGEDAQDVLHTLDLIDEAIGILARHPLIGRLAESDLRELLISHGRTGYIALYSWEADYDAVLLLALRHQRQAGFRDN